MNYLKRFALSCAFLCALAAASFAQPAQCTVTGTMYKPAANASGSLVCASCTFRIIRTIKNNQVVSTSPVTVTTTSTGTFSFTVLADSQIQIQGEIYGYQTPVSVNIPASGSCPVTLESLTTATPIISTGLTIKSNNATLSANKQGTLDFSSRFALTESPTAEANIELAASGVTAGTCTSCNLTIDTYGRVTAKANGSSGGGTWGSITGTLSSQTDLQSALDAKQSLDADLTAIAGLSPSNDDIIQRKAGAWTNRTMAQLKADLSLNSVENTALSTWAGSANITTLGTIASGTWNGSVIGSNYGGAGSINGILKANGSGVVSAASAGTDYLGVTAPGSSGQLLYNNANAYAAVAGSVYSASADHSLKFTPTASKAGLLIYEPTSTAPATTVGAPALLQLHTINDLSYWQLAYSSDAIADVWANYLYSDGGIWFSHSNGTNSGYFAMWRNGFATTSISSTQYGGIGEVADNQFGLMLTTATPSSGATFPLTWRTTGITQAAPATALADGSVPVNHLHFYQDESTNELKAKWKESGGSVNAITFSNGGTPAGSSGAFQINSAGSFGAATGVSYASSGAPTLSVTGQSTSQLTGYFLGPNTSSAALVGIRLGTGGSSGDFIQFQNSSGTALSVVDANGAGGFGITSSLGARLHVVGGGSGNAGRFDGATLSTNTVLVARQGSSSTGNLFETQSSGGTVQVAIANGGAITQTSASAAAFESGPNGSTNPVFRLVNNTASSATGLSITGNAAGNGVTLTALSSGANENVVIAGKGTGGLAFSTGSSTPTITGDANYLYIRNPAGSAYSPIRVGQVEIGVSSPPVFISGGYGGISINSSNGVRWTSTGNAYDTADLFTRRAGAANFAFGATDAASPVAQTLSVQNVVAGTSNTAGVNWTFAASRGTGTGVGGSISFQTAPAGSSGTSQNSLSAAFTVNGDGSVSLKSVTFANLPTVANAKMIYCSDCTIASPCASGGSGALAKGINGAWVCN